MDNGYIYLLFLLLLHCVEWRLFPLISWSGMGLCWRTVFTNFRVRNPVGLQSFSLRRISARWNWVEKLVFCVLFIYLLVCNLFIYCLFVCLLFNYFKGAVCYLMHQLCGLAPWGLGWGTISMFWWVSSGLICSPLDLMQGKMWWKACLLF